MNARPPRTAAVAVAFALAAAGTFVVFLVRQGTGGHAPPPGRCEVGSTRALTPDATGRVVGLAQHRGSLWALSVERVGGARVARLLRSTSGREAPTPVATTAFPEGATVDGPIVVDGRLTFVTAAGPVLRATSFDGRAARSVEFPRGEAPPGRTEHTPGVSLASEADGTPAVAVRWGGRFGTRRLHLRDTRESPGLGPLRRDRFDAPALAVLGDSLVALHERHVGTFVDDTRTSTQLEAVAFPVGPFDPTPPRDALVATSDHLSGARLAPVDGAVIALWADHLHLEAARVDVSPSGVVVDAARVTIESDPVSHHDLAAGRGPCALAVWGMGTSLLASALRAHDATVTSTPETSIPVQSIDDLRAARVGDGVAVVSLGGASLQAWRVDLDASTCTPTLTPLALPATTVRGEGLRILGFSGDATGATLLATRDPADAASTRVTRIDIDPSFRVAPPVTELVPQSVGVGARFDAQIALVAGPSRETVRLQRLGDAGDDEPGEDVLLRHALGRQLAMTASAARHRIWVADRSDASSNTFHPPHAVVLHSVIDTLEDGPRTEVATGAPPEASFASAMLCRLPAAPEPAAWALVTSPDPQARPGLDGPWAFLFSRDDVPVRRAIDDGSPFAHGAPLLPGALRSSRDRVSPVAWRGPTMAAVVSGPRAGVRLVTGDPVRESLRDVPLCDTPASMIRGATVLARADGWVAFWLDVTHTAPTLRVRRFDARGVPSGAPETLGEFLHLDEASLPSSLAASVMGTDEFAVAVPTPHGVRLAEVRCAR